MFEILYTKKMSILWTILAVGSLLKLINPFGESHNLGILIDDITLTVIFGGIAFGSWIQYYKKKKEKMTDKPDNIKDEKNA